MAKKELSVMQQGILAAVAGMSNMSPSGATRTQSALDQIPGEDRKKLAGTVGSLVLAKLLEKAGPGQVRLTAAGREKMVELGIEALTPSYVPPAGVVRDVVDMFPIAQPMAVFLAGVAKGKYLSDGVVKVPYNGSPLDGVLITALAEYGVSYAADEKGKIFLTGPAPEIPSLPTEEKPVEVVATEEIPVAMADA